MSQTGLSARPWHSSLASRAFVMLLCSVALIGIAAFYLFKNIRRIDHAMWEFDQYMARPQEIAQSVKDILSAGESDSAHIATLAPATWSETTMKFLEEKTATLWDRSASTPGAWESVHRRIPRYREAILGHIENGRCHLDQIVRHTDNKSYSVGWQEALFPFDDYCDHMKDLSTDYQSVYVSRLLGWFTRREEQIPDGGDDPFLAVGGVTTYDGIIRFGRLMEPDSSGGPTRFILLALDYRLIYDAIIHAGSYPHDPIVFPNYRRGDYSYLIDPDGWIIAHPKLWDMKGYERDGATLVPAWNDNGDQQHPIRYTSASTERIGFDVAEVLAPRDLTKPMVRSFKSLSGLVRTRIFVPIQYGTGDYHHPGYFAIVVHGVDNAQFYSSIEGAHEKIQSVATQTKRITGLMLALFALILSVIIVLWRKHISLPLRRLAGDIGLISLSQTPQLNVERYQRDPQDVQDVIRVMNGVFARYVEQSRQLQESRTLCRLGEMGAQVAHDIRSPLTALKVAVGHLLGVSEEQRVMMRNAVQRIEDIANDLAARKVAAATEGGLTVHLMSSLVETLISEKRTQYRGRYGVRIEAQLDASTYGLFARVGAAEFNRVVSNLVNNGIEALAESGVVTVAMCREGERLAIRVTDSGQGIPPEVVPQLMQRGVTIGKASGSGLGLYHARTAVEGWSGSMGLESTVGVGTTVTIRLPLAEPPAWFMPELVVPAGGTVIVIDDDSSIHQVWQGRCEQIDLARHGTTLQHFTSSAEALQWKPSVAPSLYLCDYELLGEPSNGLDLIEQLGVTAQAVLVTSRYEDPAIQQRCVHMGVRLLPKGLAGLVPLRVADVAADDTESVELCPPVGPAAGNSMNGPRILVIDDDSGIRFAWTIAAEEFGLAELATFESMEACEAAAPAYDQYDVAFVDKHVPKSAWSIDMTLTYLKQVGVHRVIVASGENLADLQADSRCAGADGFVAGKIPEDLTPYLPPSTRIALPHAATG